jgi:hypothetical protein
MGLGKMIPILLEKGIIKKALKSLKAKNESSLFNQLSGKKKYSNMSDKSVINQQVTNSRNFYKKI